MKTQYNKEGKIANSVPEKEELLRRREAIKKIKYAAVSAATLMILMPSKAKADTRPVLKIPSSSNLADQISQGSRSLIMKKEQ